mmetsp:Transcript_19287/g.8965  ORF Transcript_19287/g.8965 Transcript_19287/m.8965 type:complete len:146 (-) Transcript_19287:36-473(-)
MQYLIATFAGLMAIFLAIILIDMKGIGRRYSLCICFILAALFYGISSFMDPEVGTLWVICVSFGKLFNNAAFEITVCFVNEVFPTNTRGKAMGFIMGFSSVISIGAPLLIMLLLTIDPNAPYFLFMVLTTVSSIVIFGSRVETMD